ncbi:MAG: 16S rRNA (cytosine(967)-C(5))-methyltransferase RsmB [Lachnospiraceae bacterium]|nr:16S rRNA (cytosine(967)-C(5))-methyltransferase RsmB [Lachnospiraceae bacterium]
MTKQSSAREIALDVLLEVQEEGRPSHVVLKQALDKYRYLEKQDRAFVTRLAEGTLEYELQLDEILNRYSKIKVSKMKPLIRALLRMSVYQLLYMERVPDPAVCNEAVGLARKRRFEGLSGFVNGVLRTISREKEDIAFSEPWLAYSIPEWMLSMWEHTYGKETAKRIAASFLEGRPLTVRCNESLAPVSHIRGELEAQGIAARSHPFGEGLLELSGYDAPDGIGEFANGHVAIQDPASALVGRIASPAAGSFVLDVCAAPGGKALHAADLLAGTGMVEARDLTEYKVSLIEENRARCGFLNLRTALWDAVKFDPELLERADIVLADLPCSGLGIIGKKPDIKRRIQETDLAELAALQRQILKTVWQYVRPGGLLLYSTCTISRQENEDNAAWIAETLPFEKRALGPLLPECIRGKAKENCLQLLPGREPCDGFFIAAFTRKRI